MSQNPSTEIPVVPDTLSVPRAMPSGGGNESTLRPATGRRRVAASKSPEPFWLESLIIGASRWLGSLQLAIVLLAWFAAVLAVGTIVESWYSGKIAQELVYRTWWFKLLLLLLGLNIFCAAVKKWPWKKYQTGFLITHVGLLTMIAGGVLTSFSGTDGLMVLVDSAEPDIQRRRELSQDSNRALLTDESTIRVLHREGDQKPQSTELPLPTGALPWHADEFISIQGHALLRILNWLNDPFPRAWAADVPGDAKLEVLNYYPHARQEEFSPTDADGGVAALKISLKSPIGRLEQWLALNLSNQVFDRGPAFVEIVGKCPESLRQEFLNPPDPDELGRMGVLVIRFGETTRRLLVDKSLGKWNALGKAQIRVTDYAADYKERNAERPAFPAVEFDVLLDGVTTHYVTLARFAGVAIPVQNRRPVGADPNNIAVWYHPPDYRYGNDMVRGVLQLALSAKGEVLYRSFNSRNDRGFALEGSGTVQPGSDAKPIWKGMNWRFQVKEFLPHAVAKTRYVPQNARPGLENEDYRPALRCRLVRGTERGNEFWLAQGIGPTFAAVGNSRYELSFQVASRPLDFEVKLLRAEQTLDGQQAATYTSYIQLTDSGRFSAAWMPVPLRGLSNFLGLTSGGTPVDHEDRVITMNCPLEARGYKVYQSSYRFLEWDENGKPVSLSGFTIGRDPGLGLKYCGSTMLAAGIACMFYMKAYFFRARGDKTAPQ